MLLKNNLPKFPRIVPIGARALLLELGRDLDPSVNQQVHRLDSWLGDSPLWGVQEWVPAYASLLVYFDPLKVDSDEVHAWLVERLESCPNRAASPPREVDIAVQYGGTFGPDLAFVAEHTGLDIEEVVRRHTAPLYHVAMMGFTPGFAYLMGLDPQLATPRLASPRTWVPAGAVGIAGSQTGIYPLDSPGGWRLIGQTEARLFDPRRETPFLLSPGDRVRFICLGVEA
jgi:KipI family sensor histidine kinase inhibitor